MGNADIQTGPRSVSDESFGRRVGWFARIFGCYHSRMSRPVTTDNVTYKYCADCGIRRCFDPVKFKPVGNYFYPVRNDKLHHV